VILILPFRSTILVFNNTSLLKPIGVLVGLLWVVSVLISPEARYLHLPQFYLTLAGFVIFNILSMAWSVDQSLTSSSLLNYVLILGLVTMIWDICDRKVTIDNLLQMFVLGSFVPAVLITLDFILTSSSSVTRFGGGNFDINATAGMLAIAIPMAWYLATQRQSNVSQILNYAFIPLSIFAIILTGSRQSIVALLPSALYITYNLFTYGDRRVKLGFLGVLIGSVLLFTALIPPELLERIVSIPFAVITAESMQIRFDTWAAGLEVFIRHPLIGVGSGTYRSAIIPFKGYSIASDTTLFTILVEVGIVGFSIFLAYFAFVFRALLFHISTRNMLWPVIFGVWFPLALVNNWENTPMTWVIFTLIIKDAHLKVTNQPSLLVSRTSS